MNIKILVATHKNCRLPKEDIYLPIQVGKAGKSLDLGIVTDDTGDNISEKNANYCELTAVYWAWKNLTADYIGLAHYRRHFASSNSSDKWDNLLTQKAAETLFAKTDIILPKKRKYYIESVYNHYIHSHKQEGLDIAIAIIEKYYPDYVSACKTVMNRSWVHMFNMFVMKKDKFDDYCSWLFDILFKLEKELDISSYSAFEARIWGRISEIFLDVWLEKNQYSYIEVPVMFMEKQNWLHKGGLFLLRKLGVVKTNERY